MATRTNSYWLFILTLVVLHLVLRLALGISLVPDLIVVAALLGARRLGGWQAALFGVGLGVLADSLALVGFGASAVAFVIVCYLGSRTRNLFEGDSILFVAVYAFIGAWLISVIRFIAVGADARSVGASWLITGALLNALFVAIAAVVALIVYRAITDER